MILAQATVQIPEIAWSAISPELALFGVGILVLLLDTAGRQRVQASFVAMAVLLAAAGAVAWRAGQPGAAGGNQAAIAGLVALAGIAQFALTWQWRDRPRVLGAVLCGLGFAAGLGATIWQWGLFAGQLTSADGGLDFVGTETVVAGMVAVDGVALFTRATVCIAGLVTLPLGFAYLQDRRIHRGEYYPLLLFAATGMTLLASAADFLMVFIAIEVLSLSLYVLAGFARRDLNSQESALKYFLLGAFSSALLLYGVALVYGVTGTTNIAEAGAAFASLDSPTGVVLAAMALLIVGLAFKTALVPFHMWTPDVYQGAPTPVTGFMAAATKAAAFAVFFRIFVGAFGPIQWFWTPALATLAALTMLVGAILAVVQTDVKRMLGYSAISHAGYIAIGLVTLSPGRGALGGLTPGRLGTSAMLFYLLVYAVTTIGSFGVLSLFERRTRKAMTLADLRGIGRAYPTPSLMFGLFLLSLAGIPGTAGFIAKLGMFRAGVAAGQIALVVIMVVSSVIAAFFYVRVIASMFLDVEPADAEQLPVLATTTGINVGLAVSAAAVVVLGVLPSLVVGLAQSAATYAG